MLYKVSRMYRMYLFCILQTGSSSLSELKIQIADEREGIRDVWKITNPANLEPASWTQGQVKIEAITQDVNYWVRFTQHAEKQY